MSVDQFLLSADTTDLNYPDVRPTLDLNFARTKVLDPRITFTRASGGSYVGADGLIKYAGVNEPRFDHDPATGESLGLLIEEARTNLLLRSEVFTFGNPWFYSNSSNITLNSIISPDGKNTAAKWSFDTQTLGRILSCPATVTANTNHTFSVYVKSSGLKYIAVFYGKSGSPFTRFGLNVNLLDGTFSNIDIGSPTSASIRKVDYFGDGWHRIQIGGIFDTTSTDGYVELRTRNINGTSENLIGDGVSGYYVWGAQLEQGSFPTSYIPTQASTRTRGADQPRITGKNFTDFYNQPEGTIKAEYSYNTIGTQNHCPFSFDNGTSLQTIVEANFAPNGDRILSSGGANAGIYYYNVGENIKRTIGYKLRDFATSVQGSSLSTVTTFIPPIPNQLCIGHAGYFSSSRINGHIRSLTYYSKRLPNEQLIALTR